jgi:hypothetical protein
MMGSDGIIAFLDYNKNTYDKSVFKLKAVVSTYS